METNALHQPVMLNEAIDGLQVQPDQVYVDATFGRGGHTRAILNLGGKVIAFDHDQAAVAYGEEHFQPQISTRQLQIVRANFTQMKEELQRLQVEHVDGILFDFGTSVDQLKSPDRGFSFEFDAPLDMRMDDRLGVQAKDLLAILPENQLSALFHDHGEEESRKIASTIVRYRSKQPLVTTQQLSRLIESVKNGRRGKLHPATKVFQALRVAVNTELYNIEHALPQAIHVLNSGGRIVTISFHEGEDGRAKRMMKQWELSGLGMQETKHPIEPSDDEVSQNPRSRSAKLRIFIKK